MRFDIGQMVQVNDVIWSRYSGQLATVLGATWHKSGKTSLDKYTLEFTDGTKSVFWSIQLKPAAQNWSENRH